MEPARARSTHDVVREFGAALSGGRTERTWQLIDEFAREHWLADAADLAPAHRAWFYQLTTSAADALGMVDEAHCALLEFRHWARSVGDHAAALCANALLAYQALNAEPGVHLHAAESPVERLRGIAADFDQWRPSPDATTLGEDSSIDGAWLAARGHRDAADKLVTAATTAYTAAVSTGQLDLAAHFEALVRRLGTTEASPADKLLWTAQVAWAQGRRAAARRAATQALGHHPTSDFEAHDLLATFAMLDATEQDQRRDPWEQREQNAAEGSPDFPEGGATTAGTGAAPVAAGRGVGLDGESSEGTDWHADALEHWLACADIAQRLGAGVLSLRQSELAARVQLSDADATAALETVDAALRATRGVPVSPFVLNLRAIEAEAAGALGMDRRAWDAARSAASWSEFSPDDDRTAACYTVAALSGIRLGLEAEVMDIHQRRVDLALRRGHYITAATVLEAQAYLADEPGPYLARAWEALERARATVAAEGNPGSATPEADRAAGTDADGSPGAPAAPEDGGSAGSTDTTDAPPDHGADLDWHRAEWHLVSAQLSDDPAAGVAHARCAASAFHDEGDQLKEATAWLILATWRMDAGGAHTAQEALDRAVAALPLLTDPDAEADPELAEALEVYRHVSRRLGS